jgi:hypothetical protein
VLLNWLASGRGPLLLSSRVAAGLWTPEPVDLPVADALKMAKGNAARVFLCRAVALADSGCRVRV